MVHSFAMQYFALPTNHTSIIDDAVVFVEKGRTIGSEREKYNYIVHDVFTGGAEPANLFTQEFLQGLSESLKPDGVIAIVSRHRQSPAPVHQNQGRTDVICTELCR